VGRPAVAETVQPRLQNTAVLTELLPEAGIGLQLFT
jgi:hypothetical protein